jgi:putative transposase
MAAFEYAGAMPRRTRCILPGVPCHVTQRGVNRCVTFLGDADRLTYLQLLRLNLADAAVRILAWCLMSNHLHLIAVPDRADSLSVVFRRVHGRYAQYFNAHAGRTGHWWQNRFYACVLGTSHLWSAMAYVERNPVRAGIVRSAGDYLWSSAAAHLTGVDAHAILDMDWWRKQSPGDWAERLGRDDEDSVLAFAKMHIVLASHSGKRPSWMR